MQKTKTAIMTAFASASLLGFVAVSAAAHMADGSGTVSSVEIAAHTAEEEAEGKAVWEKLQAKQISCADLADEDFEALGEYFMGVMLGDAHAAMNEMMIR